VSSSTTPETPESITTFEAERPWQDADLDLAYVDALALDLARILKAGGVAEASYSPGDGTRYCLVIVPLTSLRAGQPRVVEGRVWERHAISGMKRADGDDGGHGDAFYHPSGYLLSIVNHGTYPIRLEGRGPNSGIAGSYVDEHWGNLGPTSGVSVAILLRAICFHLETCVPADCTGYRDADRPGDGIQHDGDTCPVHETGSREVFVVFDGPPSHQSGRFVELETRDGESVGGVNWEHVSSFTDHTDTWRLGPLLLPERTDG
jgi:hypothetical protein